MGRTTLASFQEALERAYAHPGLSLVHVPVYCGEAAQGGIGSYGRLERGQLVVPVQGEYHRQSL